MSQQPGDVFQLVRTLPPGSQRDELQQQFPFYPLNSPGIPVPGPNFIAAAVAMGDEEPVFEGKSVKTRRLLSWGPNLEYLYHRALYDEDFTLTMNVRNQNKIAQFVPGHLIGDETEGFNGGPRPAKVMILSKMPGAPEVEQKRNFVGPASQILLDALDELGVEDREEFYITNLVPWPQLDDQASTLPVAQKNEAAILLQQTLRLVKPDYLLCLGSDASKHLLGTQFGVQSMTGRVQNVVIPVHERGEEPMYHTIKVMAATHPAAVLRTPEMYPEFQAQLAQFISLTNGAEIGQRERFIKHVNVYKARHLKRIVDEIRNDPNPGRRIIAVDGEWEGEYPGNEGSYLRTVQFSTAHGEAYCVVLRHQGGTPAFKPAISDAIVELNRLLKTDADAGYYPRPGGHFLRADLPWLIHAGIDIREEYAPPDDHTMCRYEGGWDTGLMYHAVNETASYRLTDMTVRLTRAPVYDARLKQHITDYCKDNDLKKDDLEGFGFLPDWLLHPEPTDPEWGDNYAQYDADVTRRIAIRHLQDGGLLDSDWYGNQSWEPFWRSHRASLGVLEMEMTGLMIDKDRVDELTTLFMTVYEELLHSFRRAINWESFNPNSNKQCVAFLFGDDYAFKHDKKTNTTVLIKPPEAVSLNLMPVKTTGKRSRLWVDVVKRGEQRIYTPSTDKEVLGIVGHHNPLAMQLRDLKFIGQVLKGPLRRPEEDENGQFKRDGGHFVYKKGLASAAQFDGNVHTHLSQNKETGRGSSSRPPLQNISKRREGDYSRIMGTEKTQDSGIVTVNGDYTNIFPAARYRSPIRTIFRAPPGYVLVEADYTGAELAVIAWLANDPTMIEHVRRNALPESHPDHFDIHSNRAVNAFQLSCPATKRGLKEAGYAPLRVAAKNVNFGIPYGPNVRRKEPRFRSQTVRK